MKPKYNNKSNYYLIIFLIFFSFTYIIWTNKDFISHLFNKNNSKNSISPSHHAHNLKIIDLHSNSSFGIDVSEYQGTINWKELKNIENIVKIDFIIIRSTAGNDKLDHNFKKNWYKASQNQLIKGAYHYYRPNENSIEQAKNYIKNVKLKKGDFPPILDIEKLPKTQSIDSLKVGLKRWLNKVENHYGVQPIIYTGESYYNDFLHDEFQDYQFWIANYNLDQEQHYKDCILWQFSENGNVDGIKTPVDLNVFNGGLNQLKKILIS